MSSQKHPLGKAGGPCASVRAPESTSRYWGRRISPLPLRPSPFALFAFVCGFIPGLGLPRGGWAGILATST